MKRTNETHFRCKVLQRSVHFELICGRDRFIFSGHRTEIGKKEMTALIDKNVLRLKIAMNEMHGVVKVIHSRCNLFFNPLDISYLRHVETN